MPSRRLIFSLLFAAFIFSMPASGLSLQPLQDPAMESAARAMKAGNHKDALAKAKEAAAGGARDFLVGMAAFKAGDDELAVTVLAKAAESYPLLADYSLAVQSQALFRLGRYSEALQPLEKLAKAFPDSPHTRASTLLHAEALMEKGDFSAAIAAFQKFIEKYPSGNDSLTALYKTALALDLSGNTAAAALSLRQIWLNSPASPVAAKAEAELKTLQARGAAIRPYTPEELYRRGVALYDLGRYQQAVSALKGVPREGQSEDFLSRLSLKTAQALLRARQYREAEQLLTTLAPSRSKGALADETNYWLGRAMDKNGKEDSAAAVYLKLAEAAPASDFADDALYEAALIKKWQKKNEESLAIFARLLKDYPESRLTPNILWEAAWLEYQVRDFRKAAESFRKLCDSESIREKALYWYGRSLAQGGDAEGAKAAFAALVAEYPFGFYALSHRKGIKPTEEAAVHIPETLMELLPVPEGFERAKALIAFGLHDEAEKELSAYRKKANGRKNVPALARLYLETGNYNAALNLVAQELPRTIQPDNVYAWGLSYPVPYRDAISKHAAESRLAENLIYAVIRSESNFSPTAKSPVGALGLMQLMPATAESIIGSDSRQSITERLTRPEVNIKAGVKHLQDLVASYKGDLVLAVAAYNAGSSAVNRWLKKYGDLPRDEFIETIPYRETREYVKKVLSAAEAYNRFYRLGSSPEIRQTAVPPEPQPDAPVLQASASDT